MQQNPWNRPPLPAVGDTKPEETYAGVGKVLSQWEQTEIQLGYLHSAFLFRHLDWEAMIKYGKGATFRSRSALLIESKNHFFVKVHDQNVEAEFDALYQKVTSFSDRRNEVAHAVVRDETWADWLIPNYPDPNAMGNRWFLLPSHYKSRNFNENLLPEFAYTAPTLLNLAQDLMMLALEIQGFSARVVKL